MANPVLPPIPCQKCESTGRRSMMQETENGRFADAQGRLCAQLLCFVCGSRPQGGVPLVVYSPPHRCRQCGFVDQPASFVKAGPEVNAANSSIDFLNAMRSTQAIPDQKTFLDQTRPNSVPGGGI